MRKSVSLACIVLAVFVHAASAQKAPGEKEAKALALDSLLAFNKAIEAEDFTGFHKQIAALWQAQVTPAKLKSIFQAFLDQDIDLSGVTTVEPIFTQRPAVDDDGVLVLQGNYPTTPVRIDFRLKYVYEKTAWKLIGIKVDAKPAGAAGKLPTTEEAKDLVRESLSAFNAAVQTNSFVDFHKHIAVMWQRQVTPDRLAQLFDGFVKGGIDISGIALLEPTFDQPPATNENGILELKGSYPMKASKVIFDLGYLYEGTEWKLVKINVNVRPPEPETATNSSKAAPKKEDDDDDE
jgi:hypothetical protein